MVNQVRVFEPFCFLCVSVSVLSCVCVCAFLFRVFYVAYRS